MTGKGRITEPALLALATLGSGLYALVLGQDANFDQLNYHVYLGWSLLANRIDLDVAPAGLVGSYLNPAVQAFHYLGLTLLPPRLFGFSLGAAHGLNAYLAYRLTRHVLKGIARERLLSAAAGLLAAVGPCAVSLLATTFGDNLLSILILAALLLQLEVVAEPGRDPTRRLVAAGLLAGAAAGLKLTLGIYVIALLASAAAVAVHLRRARVAFVFALAAVAGGLISAGYWSYEVWRRFGNPVFPFLNNLFHSPFFKPVGLRDGRWALHTWTGLATTPVEMALGSIGGLQEVACRDLRYLVLLVATAGALATALWSRREPASAAPAVKIVVVGWFTAYLAWALVFHYYRYFATGEFLAPVAIVALLRLIGDRPVRLAWPALALLVVATTGTSSWGRMPWRDEPLRVSVPLREPATVFVDSSGISFALPFFPPGSRFVTLDYNGPAVDRLAARVIESQTGPVFRLQLMGAPPVSRNRFGFVDDGPCEVFRSGGRGRLSLCRLRRVSP